MESSPRRPDLGCVRDIHVIEAVGLESIGLLHWLAAQAVPAPELPGSWVVTAGVRELVSSLRMGNDKWLRMTSSLQAAGLIHVEVGKRFGRGGGSTPNRYWMTFDPSVPSPRGPREPFAVPAAALSTGQHGGFQDGNIQSGNRHLVSVREAASPAAAPVSGTPSIASHPVDDGSSSAVRTGVPRTPAFLLDALRHVGWQGAPPDGDPLLLAAVARHLVDSGTWSRPAGQLNRLVSQGKLEDYALLHDLVSTDPTGALTEYVGTAPSAALMAYPALCELQNDQPEWYAMVLAEAARIAGMRGEKVSMMLIRETAAAIEPPGAQGQARTS